MSMQMETCLKPTTVMQRNFDMTSLLRRTDEFDEEVSVYGVETDSAYVKLKGYGFA